MKKRVGDRKNFPVQDQPKELNDMQGGIASIINKNVGKRNNIDIGKDDSAEYLKNPY